MRSLLKGLRDRSGSTAVEFALVVFPFLMFCLGILQFLFLHYTQQTLSDALYTSASNPETELTTANKSGYVTKICNKNAFKTSCTSGIKVEMMRLADLPTAVTAISGSTFSAGASGDLLVLRASMAVPRIVAFIPQMTAKDSVIFRRQ